MKSHLLASLGLLGATLTSATITLPPAGVTIQPGEKVKPGKFNGKPRYLTWLADSEIKRGVAPTNAYTTSVLYSGIMLAHNRTGDKKYLDYVKFQIDMLLYPDWNGNIVLYNNSLSLDDIRVGHSFLDVYEATGSEIYKTASNILRGQINKTPRTPKGGFYHRYPTYVDQMWLDGIYMVDVFYARYTALFEPTNATAWDDIARQFDLIDAGTRINPATNGLPLHGFDAGKTAIWADPITGACPHVWNRAVGWYIMALVDTLDYFPTSHPGRERLIGYLKSLVDAIVQAQDKRTKGWWLVMTPGYEGKPGNYIESSGSIMFVYGILKALRLGYISGKKYSASALSGYELMVDTFAVSTSTDNILNLDWTVQTGSLSSNGTFEYYISIPLYQNDLKGVGPFLFAAYEYELLHKTK